MERLSYMRKTPEGWEISMRRMVALQHVRVDPATARAIVKYLSNAQGLAPAEARPARFESERRAIDYKYAADPKTEQTCRACHSLGRVISQRRTKDEWELLLATHRAYYPLVDFQASGAAVHRHPTAPGRRSRWTWPSRTCPVFRCARRNGR
jgi:quinohemoprotein amine dehydrogenase